MRESAGLIGEGKRQLEVRACASLSTHGEVDEPEDPGRQERCEIAIFHKLRFHQGTLKESCEHANGSDIRL